jgi:hypothetical protein
MEQSRFGALAEGSVPSSWVNLSIVGGGVPTPLGKALSALTVSGAMAAIAFKPPTLLGMRSTHSFAELLAAECAPSSVEIGVERLLWRHASCLEGGLDLLLTEAFLDEEAHSQG